MMRDWRIFRCFSLGVGIWEDSLTNQIDKVELPADFEGSTLLESKFASKIQNWNSLTISEKLEQVDKGKSYFLKITSEEGSYLTLPTEFSKHTEIAEERVSFILKLAQSLVLSNLCLLGSAPSMEAQDIYEIKRNLEDIVNSTNEISEKITPNLKTTLTEQMAQVYVSKDFMITLGDLHFEKSRLTAAVKHKKQDQSNLNEMYVSLWRLSVEEIQKIAESRKVSSSIWLASLSPLQHLAFYRDMSIGSSLHDSEILDKPISKRSFNQDPIAIKKDSLRSGHVSHQKIQQPQLEPCSPTRLTSLQQQKSPNSLPHPTAAMAPTSIQAPPLPPLPLKKKRSKKARNFDVTTPS